MTDREWTRKTYNPGDSQPDDRYKWNINTETHQPSSSRHEQMQTVPFPSSISVMSQIQKLTFSSAKSRISQTPRTAVLRTKSFSTAVDSWWSWQKTERRMSISSLKTLFKWFFCVCFSLDSINEHSNCCMRKKNLKRSVPINTKASMLNFADNSSFQAVTVQGVKPKDLSAPDTQYNTILIISPEVSHFDAAFILSVLISPDSGVSFSSRRTNR